MPMKTQVLSPSGCLRLRGGAIERPRDPLEAAANIILDIIRKRLLWKPVSDPKLLV